MADKSVHIIDEPGFIVDVWRLEFLQGLKGPMLAACVQIDAGDNVRWVLLARIGGATRNPCFEIGDNVIW